jgi:MFS family permease
LIKDNLKVLIARQNNFISLLKGERRILDLARFLQIYIIQGGFALFFLYMAFKVLRRGTKRTNLYLSSFYLSTFIGGTINIIYANIFVETIVLVLYFITYYILCFSMIFLFMFVLILLKPPDRISKKIQYLILILFSFVLLALLFIPNGIVIDETTNWKPDWNWSFFLISTILMSSIVIIPTSYYSIKIHGKLGNLHLKKKWKYFLIGLSAYFFLYYGTSYSNTLNNNPFRLIWAIISLPTLLALYLIYYGVGRQLD